MLADRINMLDHLTRGRVMFGVGPGALVSDARMMGIEPTLQRDMMDQSLAVLVRLLRGETVTHKTDWFTLQDARLQMLPYSQPGVEFAVASQVSPTGARAAGRHGLGLLSIGATSTGGFNALASNWAIAEEQAAIHGTQVDRAAWRLVGPMHVAETREKAREDVRFGLKAWLAYFRDVANLPMAPEGEGDPVDILVKSGLAAIGTPDDAVAQLERLEKQSGGFGAFLLMAHNWADWAETQRSYELIARYVMPRVQGTNVGRQGSYDWGAAHSGEFMGQARMAVGLRIAQHIGEQGTKDIRPEILALMGLKQD
jgi:limonene 1,2-monooxygenase